MTEQEEGLELYLELYDKDIVDAFGRIYISDGVYLCPNGKYEVDDL
jgi:hypothetical protein